MFVTINKPTFKSFKPIYNVLEIVFYLNSREFDIAKSIIEKHKINKTISKKNLEITERIFIIEDKNQTIDNIEELYKTNNKMKILNVESTFIIMKYYYLRENIEKAKEYAKKLIEYKTDFIAYNNLATKILDENVE